MMNRLYRIAALWLVLASPAFASQATLVTPGPPLPMTSLAAFLNAGLLSIGSCNSGNSAPANGTGAAAFPGECWINTTANPWVFSFTADGTHWSEFGTLNTSSFVWTPYSNGFSAVLAGNLSTAGAFTQAGAFPATITVTAATNSTLPAGTHTLAALDVAQTWSALQTLGAGFAANSSSSINASGATLTLQNTVTTGSNGIKFLNPSGTNIGGVFSDAPTGNVFLSAFGISPAVTIAATTGAVTLSSLVSAGTQCVQASSTGVFSVTGSACGGSGSTGANPTASAGPAAINGTASTFMRSDGAPAIQQGSASQKGIVQVDGISLAASSGTISATGTFTGRPWVDVTSGSNGCAAAVGNGSTDDQSAIQCQINFMNSTYGGGFVFMPPGNYHVGSTVDVIEGIWLEGTGIFSTKITVSADVNPVRFETSGGVCPGGNHYGGMEKIQVNGFNNAAATTPAVIIGDNCNVTIKDSILWYGQYGLFNNGVDSNIESTFIYGFFANLSSNGANWYIRDKFDQAGANPSYGYIQGTAISGLSVAENHFIQCDFSDTFSSGNAIIIQDTSNVAITTISDSVLAGGISITGARATMLAGNELGGNIVANAGILNIVGSYGLSAVTASGSATRSCAGNASVTC